MSIQLKTFKNGNTLIKAAAGLLKEYMQAQSNDPHAIMLPGGRTPIPVYREIADNPFTVSAGLHIMMSDERMAPENSGNNNFALTTEMLSSLGIGKNRIMKVDTSLDLDAAAARYDRDICHFFRNNGRLSLALLGMGTDGHTASLFRTEDIENARGRFAIPVSGEPAFARVSVTPETIRKAERIVFLVTGKEKETVIAGLMNNPDSVIAGLVAGSTRNTEIWFAG